jgi:hypothetical protein
MEYLATVNSSSSTPEINLVAGLSLQDRDADCLRRWPHLRVLSPEALRCAEEVLANQLAVPPEAQHPGVIAMASRALREHAEALRGRRPKPVLSRRQVRRLVTTVNAHAEQLQEALMPVLARPIARLVADLLSRRRRGKEGAARG